MKKLVLICSVALVLVLVLGLTVSCKKSDTTNPTTTTTTTKTTTVATTTKTTTAATTTATTTAVTTTATTTAAAAPPKNPHIDGRFGCITCHKDGLIAAPIFPTSPSHTAYTDANCTLCHTTTTTSSIPARPAGHASASCSMCHKTGGLAVAPPASHAPYSDTTPANAALCLACHK